MFLELLWAVLRFGQWEDTVNFHARLFRCFLLGFLDTHSKPAVLSQGSKWMLAVLGQRFTDVDFTHDTGHLHEPAVFHTAFPLSCHSALRCPPKRRYETTSLPLLAVNSPMGSITSVPPSIFSQSINNTNGLYGEPMSPVAFHPPGSGRVSGPPVGVIVFFLLWLLTLAMIISRCSTMGLDSTRAMRRPRRVVRPLPEDHRSTNEANQRKVPSTPKNVDHQASMPGSWFHDRQEQSTLETLEESVFDTILWTLCHSRFQMGMNVWAHFPGLASILATLDPCSRGLNDVTVNERKSDDGFSPAYQGLGGGVSVLPALDGSEQQDGTQGHIYSESDLSIRSLRELNTAMHDQRCEPLAIGDVATKDPAWITTPDAVCGEEVGSTFALMTSRNADRLLCREDISCDVDESASEDGSHDTEDEGLFGADTQYADFSALERKDEHRVLGRRRDGALSDTCCPPSLRRTRSSGYLWQKRDILDNDEGADDDSYWTEQVNARLSGQRDSRRASCRYGWFGVSSWPREGREDETDDWRTWRSRVTQFSMPGETSDPVQCQVEGDSTELRRYSSPPLDVVASLSHRAGSGDGPQGIYVVPQRRGRMMASRCRSPVSSPGPFDCPSGLGFFPFRKTPSLLTPEAWRPGCLYIPDPPEEARQADAWWDGLKSADECGTGTVVQDAAKQGLPFPQDALDAPISWRDRHENDPASRRFISVHRRAMTEGSL